MTPRATRRRSRRLDPVPSPSPSSSASLAAFPSQQNSTPDDDSQDDSQSAVADLLLNHEPAVNTKGKGAMQKMLPSPHAALPSSPGTLSKRASQAKSTIGFQALEESLSEQSRSQSLLADSSDRDDDDDVVEEEQQLEVEDEDAPISDAVLAMLNVNELVKGWNRCSLELNGGATVDIKTSDVVVVRGGKPGNEWVCEVRQIKSLLTDTVPLLDDEGHQQKTPKGVVRLSASNIYIQNAWAYSTGDLKKLPKDPRIHPFLPHLGPLEYVMTDMLNWHKQVDIIGLCTPVFDFNDLYPATTSEDPDAHPLQYHPAPRKRRLPPLYFFGDRGENGGKDAKFNDTPTAKYIRTLFKFYAVKPIKGKGKGKETRTRSPTTIKLNLHSTSKTPYTPSLVQHYSRTSRTWYHTSDLVASKSYRSSTPSSSAETDYEQEPTHANGCKRRAAARPPQGTAKRVKDSTIALEGLANAPIVRGGAYGLIGNSYLVTRAGVLLAASDEDAVVEGETLVAAAEEWAAIVERRTRSGLERGRAPGGATWVCPVSGVAI